MAEQKAVQLTVSGTVIGVNFRSWTKKIAQRSGVTGWIRNNVDRTVTLHVEGVDQVVDEFIEQLRRPNLPSATVEDIQVRDAETHGYSEFAVQY